VGRGGERDGMVRGGIGKRGSDVLYAYGEAPKEAEGNTTTCYPRKAASEARASCLRNRFPRGVP
jgi:hypothetical protein